MRNSTKLLIAENALVAGLTYQLFRKRLVPSIRIADACKARHPDDLNLGIPPIADATHFYSNKNYFEWWYFDAHFDDGHSFVGGLMDPAIYRMGRKDSHMYLHIYTPEGEKLHNFVFIPRNRFSASNKTCDVELGANRIRGAYPVWTIHLMHEDFEVQLEFKNKLPGWCRGNGELLFGNLSHPKVFGWLIAQPRADVSGIIKYRGETHNVTGEGYHDHNWGNMLFPLYIKRWHWGRIVTPEITFIFADVITGRKSDNVHIPMILIGKENRLELETYEMEWNYYDYKWDSRKIQKYPSRVVIRFEERGIKGEVVLRVREEIEINDLLEHLGIPAQARRLLRILNQPCYYRFVSEYEIDIDFKGDRVSTKGSTIQEYIINTMRRGRVPDDKPFRHFLP